MYNIMYTPKLRYDLTYITSSIRTVVLDLVTPTTTSCFDYTINCVYCDAHVDAYCRHGIIYIYIHIYAQQTVAVVVNVFRLHKEARLYISVNIR